MRPTSSWRSTGCRPWPRPSRASASSSPGSAMICARELQDQAGRRGGDQVTSPKVWTVNGVARAAPSRQPRRRGSPGLWRHACGFRGGAGDPRDEGARAARDLLSLPADGRAARQHAAEPLFATTPRRPASPAFPWRGRITCSPAAGYAGTVDKTAAAATQVASFFGAAPRAVRVGRHGQLDRPRPATGACAG
jgi:hypothetical protein